jgi:cytochrome o ubiquinol oxidase subunit 1
MPLYVLGFLGMSRRMEQYDVADWQPYLVTAFIGAILVLIGIVCIVIQFYVSFRDREKNPDLTGDPWNGRTLEWATSSPPAPYNFAIVPVVDDIDAFYEMKRRGIAYPRPDRYEDIEMPNNTALGITIGGLGFVLGFAMVWHIWWLAVASIVGVVICLIIRSSNDDDEHVFPAAEVERIEKARLDLLDKQPKHEIYGAAATPGMAGKPVPGGA